MNKSDILDEIRLEVGKVPDYADNLQEFYLGIVGSIGKYLANHQAVGLFLVKDQTFQLVASIGVLNYCEKEMFGKGNLSLCAIRGGVSTHELFYQMSLLTPFYNGHHLTGILVVNVPKHSYHISEEDYIFLKELSRFIERYQKRYRKSS